MSANDSMSSPSTNRTGKQAGADDSMTHSETGTPAADSEGNPAKSAARFVSGAGSAASDALGNVARSARDEGGKVWEEARHAGANVAATAKESASTFAGDLEKLVRRYPLGAIATTFLVGLYMGLRSR